MTRKPSRRSSIIEVGSGPSRVRIYTIRRKDGYSQFTLAWKEGGRRTTRSVSCAEEARIIAQQITVRLTNGLEIGSEATRRDIELLRHCEHLAASFGVSLAAAMDEWKSARQAAGGLPIADAVRFYAANRPDSVEARTLPQVVREFLSSKETSGVSRAYIRGSGFSLEKFAEQFPGSIAGITVREDQCVPDRVDADACRIAQRNPESPRDSVHLCPEAGLPSPGPEDGSRTQRSVPRARQRH